jgi:2'-5' RNA ligase
MSQDADFERLNIALPVGPPTSTELCRLVEDIQGVKWREEEHLHLTLRFVGEVHQDLKEALVRALQNISVEPFILPVECLSVFPSRGQPHVIYAGIGSAHPRLFQLQHRVEEALASIGIPFELRAYSPHITIARTSRANPRAVNHFVKRFREFSAAPFKVDSFCLYRTQLTHFGSVYAPLNEFPLRIRQARAV